ncbi:TraB/GumN family protein [Sphaerotilus uruguayifluvii]|uniref:TraB/GumN family protein n=1 Tax=Sphaerotilus uruguayifluvii TaxID=2735897 RepID=A0ABX2G7X1_9BURK|nr:hypothetical protein [Leptothrix sp. C29]
MRGALSRGLRALLLSLPMLLPAVMPAAAQAEALCPPQAEPAPSQAQWLDAMPGPTDRGLLWRVEKDEHVSWLYATVHVGRRDWIVPGATVLSALASADRVAFELDLLDPGVLQRLQRAARVPPGQPPLPPDLAARLDQALSEACVGRGLDGLRPELQVITLVSLSLRRDGLDPVWGIDGWLARLAHARRQTVVSLETPEQQIALLTGRRPQDGVEAVRRGLAEIGDPASRRVALRLAELWAGSDAAALEDFAQWCDCLGSEAEREAHRVGVEARNPAMAERIATLHQRGSRVFAAVGALHMVGPQGLPALLARRGFRVERVLPAEVPVPARQ